MFLRIIVVSYNLRSLLSINFFIFFIYENRWEIKGKSMKQPWIQPEQNWIQPNLAPRTRKPVKEFDYFLHTY